MAKRWRSDLLTKQQVSKDLRRKLISDLRTIKEDLDIDLHDYEIQYECQFVQWEREDEFLAVF